MATASENYKLVTDYYESFGEGGPEGLARMLSFFAEGKTNYTAGNSEFAGTQNSPAESEKILHRILELNEGNLEIVGMPTILLAGDAMVAVLLKERHKRAGKPEIIVPRLCVYEIADGKLSRSFIWQLEAEAYDAYYPRP